MPKPPGDAAREVASRVKQPIFDFSVPVTISFFLTKNSGTSFSEPKEPHQSPISDESIHWWDQSRERQIYRSVITRFFVHITVLIDISDILQLHRADAAYHIVLKTVIVHQVQIPPASSKMLLKPASFRERWCVQILDMNAQRELANAKFCYAVIIQHDTGKY